MKTNFYRTLRSEFGFKVLTQLLACCFVVVILEALPSFAQNNSALNYPKLLQSGIAKHKRHRYSEAIQDYNKAIELAESPGNPYSDPQNENYNPQFHMLSMSDLYFNRGLAKSESNDYAAAVKDFSSAVKFNSSNDAAYFNRGLAEFELKQFQNALRDFNKTIALVPGDAKALYNRALTKHELGNKEAALKDAQLARKYFQMLRKPQEANEVGDFINSLRDEE
jgi:tetratricopeptide (TPR) repeat protein